MTADMGVSGKPAHKTEQMPYDLVKELTIATLLTGVLVVILAVIFSTPDVPSLSAKQVAAQAPMLLVQTELNDLSGQDSLSGYGPPYNHGTDSVQSIGPISPQTWAGVQIPINPARDEVIKPLQRLAVMDKTMGPPIHRWLKASPAQQNQWIAHVEKQLPHAIVAPDHIRFLGSRAADGPLPQMISGYLRMANAGLLEAAIDGTGATPSLNRTKSTLLLADQADPVYAAKLDMTGSEWGVIKETGNYPGAVWLWYYTLLYQIPPFNSSSASDLLVVMTVMIVTGLLMFIPFIPGIRSLPLHLRVYRLIWRDYYRRQAKR